MKFILNGSEQIYNGDPELPLLTYLREYAHITSPKNGCSPQASCGACTVELNGKAVLSCVTPMKKVAGGHVFTTEGLDDLMRQAFIVAFSEKGAVQCGFCTPGIIMRAAILLKNNPQPTRCQIREALKKHLCRCTGYIKIIDAILYAAEAIRERKYLKSSISGGKIGAEHLRYDIEQLVMGNRPFISDMNLKEMAFGALKFSDHPRAVIKSIDLTEALNVPGVIKIVTAGDIPGKRKIGLIQPDWSLMIEAGETTHYIGDVLAGVVAENEAAARQAVNLIKIDYDIKKPVSNVRQAMSTDSDLVHSGQSNILEKCRSKTGSAAQTLAVSAFKVHRIFHTQTVEHGFLEPEACIARPWQSGVEVFSAGQGIYEDQRQIAEILAISKEKINVRQIPNGGAFGGKEDLSVQGHTALFAFLIKRPVKIVLSREESIRLHPKRHPMILDYHLGCDKQGKLTALEATIIGDTGAYASVGTKVLERAVGHSTGAYYVPVVDVEGFTVYTNNIPNGAMRGFGVNQVTFAMEVCMDELCEQGGFDRWHFRYNNALTAGRPTASGQILKDGVGVRETLRKIKPFYDKADFCGIACGIKNTGIGNGMIDESHVTIEISDNETVQIMHGWTEMGQGINTVAIQALCQETGLVPDQVKIVTETKSKIPTGMTTASRATSLLLNAILQAATDLKTDLQISPLGQLKGKKYHGHWQCDWTTNPGTSVKEIITHYSYSYATQLVTLDKQGKIDCIYAAHDAGKVINPTLFEGQIEGSVHMGLGYALSEEFIQTESFPLSLRLQSCGILRAKDMPFVKVIPLEVKDPNGPYGAKGVGEIGLVPTAPAVANAFYQYDKKRRYQLPIKDYQWKKHYDDV